MSQRTLRAIHLIEEVVEVQLEHFDRGCVFSANAPDTLNSLETTKIHIQLSTLSDAEKRQALPFGGPALAHEGKEMVEGFVVGTAFEGH